MSDDKLCKFLDLLSEFKHSYMMEGFYSLWKPQTRHIITIINVSPDKQNKVYLEVVTLATKLYQDETIPFVLNVGTTQANSEPVSDTYMDELLNHEN